jgi:hypothetical protein
MNRGLQIKVAVLLLSDIQKHAKKKSTSKPKPNNANQKQFSEIIIMQYGSVKLTVGVLKSDRKKIQYCITDIKKTTDRIDKPEQHP